MTDRGKRIDRTFHWTLFSRMDNRLSRGAQPPARVAYPLVERFTFELWEKV